MRTALLTVALAGLVSALPAGQTPEPPPSAPELARQVQAHYNAVRDFKADFTQTYQGALKYRPARGTVRVKKPNRMKWVYASTDQQQLIADGRTLWLYAPNEKRAYRSPLPQGSDASAALLFLAGRGDLSRDFTPSLADPQTEGVWRLKLVPKAPQPDFKSLVLVVDRQTLALRGLVTIDDQGGTSTFQFEHFQENVGLQESEFYFSPPRGVEVIDR